MTRQATPLALRTRQVGPWGMNTYVLSCPDSGESVLIDPGAEPDALSEMLTGTTPVAILLTHTHLDHIGALNEMLSRLRVPLLAHAGPHADNIEEVLGKSLKADRWLHDGDAVHVGRHVLRVHHAPGHIDDQVCYEIAGNHRIVVGDTIFEGGPGKTWSTAGFATTCDTLRRVVLPWPDKTICYPGHGPAFRLGDVRGAIEKFLARDHGNFYGDATWDM
jgi:glyoxylase-like metal-dependent hydrolase (beta-lactamase superfamily II)